MKTHFKEYSNLLKKLFTLLLIIQSQVVFSQQTPQGTQIPHIDITPTSSIRPANGFNWTIEQVADGIIADIEPNLPGFASRQSRGTITLTFSSDWDISGFLLWNDVRIQGQGINDFQLRFFNSGNSLIRSIQLSANAAPNCCNPDTLAERFNFGTVSDVRYVELVVLNSHGNRLELREIGFISPFKEFPGGGGVKPPIASCNDACNAPILNSINELKLQISELQEQIRQLQNNSDTNKKNRLKKNNRK